MGFVSDLLGLGGKNSASFDADKAFVAQPANQEMGTNALNSQQQQVNHLNQFDGAQNQQNVFNQLQGVANGTGPNPALAQLNNQTGNNIQQQAALMGSQRGVGANPGLLARQAAMQGANIQQNAVGQGAALQANQSLSALNQLGGISGNQVNQQLQGQQAYTGNVLGALQGQNQSNIANTSQANSANAGIAQQNAKSGSGLLGGLLGGIGTAVAGPLGGAVGSLLGGSGQPSVGGGAATGASIGFAQGGEVGPCSDISKHFHSYKAGGKVPGKPEFSGNDSRNDVVPAKLSKGEIVIPNSHSGDPDKAAAFAYMVSLRAKQGKK